MIEHTPYGQVKLARGFWNWFLNRFDIYGIVVPWRTAYIRSDLWEDPGLHDHEITHLQQMNEDGVIRFYAQWLFWTWRYGYERNPYELEAEASEIEGSARRKRLQALLPQPTE